LNESSIVCELNGAFPGTSFTVDVTAAGKIFNILPIDHYVTIHILTCCEGGPSASLAAFTIGYSLSPQLDSVSMVPLSACDPISMSWCIPTSGRLDSPINVTLWFRGNAFISLYQLSRNIISLFLLRIFTQLRGNCIGSRFGDTPIDTLSVGNNVCVSGSLITWNDTAISCVLSSFLPGLAVNFAIMTNGGSSLGSGLTFAPLPIITALTVSVLTTCNTVGPNLTLCDTLTSGNTNITLTGYNFGPVLAGVLVISPASICNGTAYVLSPTAITCRLAAQAPGYTTTVTVQHNGGVSPNNVSIIFATPPIVTAISHTLCVHLPNGDLTYCPCNIASQHQHCPALTIIYPYFCILLCFLSFWCGYAHCVWVRVDVDFV
jgi:hypothetical protein